MRGSQQCDFTRYTGERKRLLPVFNGAQGVCLMWLRDRDSHNRIMRWTIVEVQLIVHH